jgi:3-oxoacyl-[acyl-carrier protein] reductase
MATAPQTRVPVALVTGASRGIDAAVARHLAAHGAHVVVNFRSRTAHAEAVVAAIRAAGGTAEATEADVSVEDDVRSMVREIKRNNGRIDVLVNNAGITADGYAAMMSRQKWDAVIETNLTGAFLCCREVIKVMLDQREGVIVNVSSVAGLVGTAAQANYSAAKAGLIGLTKSLARELSPRGVRVNAVIPGFIDTDMLSTLPPGELERQLEHVLLGRAGTADEVAAAVGWLAGADASYVTGSTLVVDGGLTLH